MLGSVHAVTETGSLVTASASGSQLGPYASGAGRVILVVGTQKIVPDLEEALHRINDYVFPLENARALTAYGVNSAVNKVLIINREYLPVASPSSSSTRTSGSRVRREQTIMATQIATAEREIRLVEDANIRPVMGIDVLEPLLLSYHPLLAGGSVPPCPRSPVPSFRDGG